MLPAFAQVHARVAESKKVARETAFDDDDDDDDDDNAVKKKKVEEKETLAVIPTCRDHETAFAVPGCPAQVHARLLAASQRPRAVYSRLNSLRDCAIAPSSTFYHWRNVTAWTGWLIGTQISIDTAA